MTADGVDVPHLFLSRQYVFGTLQTFFAPLIPHRRNGGFCTTPVFCSNFRHQGEFRYIVAGSPRVRAKDRSWQKSAMLCSQASTNLMAHKVTRCVMRGAMSWSAKLRQAHKQPTARL